MMQMTVHGVERAGRGGESRDEVSLTYEERFLRRKVLETVGGTRFLVDLPKTTSLGHGDAFLLPDGTRVRVIAAHEPLLEVTAPDLARIAWHVGNRHAPCQIEAGRLLIQRDHVLRDMLERLGACVREVSEPFTPEGGAYGHGRTHGHDHGHGQGHGHGSGTHGHSRGADGHDHDR